jgi:ribosomal protein S12 methylthiotransferase
VDAFLGTAACDRIVEAVEGKTLTVLTLFPEPGTRAFQDPAQQRRLLTGHFAYIKVSEGCSRRCTYCIIPQLRGSQRSRPMEDICKEAVNLASKGVKEIILTAENTTDYGLDLDGGKKFHEVLTRLALCLVPETAHEKADEKSGETPWIRFLYTHPQTLTQAIVQAVKDHDNICSYYDVPIQHASSGILKKMGRPYTLEDLHTLFTTIRETDPDATLRTTLIVGFPGETDRDFDTLMNFIKEVRFDHLGIFTYSDSQDLGSHRLKDHVPEGVAEKRRDTLMAAQAEISAELNQRRVDRIYEVLVEENPDQGVFIGRTMFQAPEVDGVTFIYADGLEIGTRVKVRITEAFEYDIAGEPA